MISVLNERQLKRLAEHKYSSQCVSILDPHFQVYWCWLIEQLPMWLAPNAITISGLVINVVTSLILIWYCPQAKGEAPRWAYILNAVGFFVYQSLDAVDGKQARRTKSVSALGELLDHGCDCVSMTIMTLGVCVAMELGKQPFWMFFVSLMAMFMIYCAQWQTYVSGTMKIGKVDSTEFETFGIIIFIVTGIFGVQVWSTQVPYFNVTIETVMFGISLCGSMHYLSTKFIQIYKEGKGKNGSNAAGTSVLSPLFPIAVMIYMAIHTAWTSSTSLFQKHPCIFVMAFGMACSKISIKLVVGYMTGSPVEFTDSVMIGGILQILNIHYGSPINEYVLLCCMMGHVMFEQLRYNFTLGSQISDYLNISYFRITPTVKSE